VEELKGIGPKKAEALRKSNIANVLDLLRITPARYQDRTKILPFSFIRPDGSAQGIFKGRLESLKAFHARKGLAIINAEFSDPTGKVAAKWFNKTYLTRQLKVGKEYWLFGPAIKKGGIILSNPEIEPVATEAAAGPEAALTPVYPTRTALSEAKISPLALRKLISSILDKIDWACSFPDLSGNSPFAAIARALQQVHRPSDMNEAKKAEFTLAFFDQVLFQIGVLQRRKAITGILSLPDQNKSVEKLPEFKLPFKLTNAQKSVIGEILYDLTPDTDKPPMNRLVQGDVGCGKTLVAFLTMIELCENIQPGSQCAFMAPTEVLARQHLLSFNKFFPGLASRAAILTGSQKRSERKPIEAAIAAGECHFVFGTHALFQENVEFKELAMCIIDEQQRFGVNHRRLLFRKGSNPHQLLLSATPIPRTLSLTIFGDMDTSIIDELPPGRTPVQTLIATSLSQTVTDVKEAVFQGNKVYLVCPLIEISEKTAWTSVEEAADLFEQLLPEARIACVTGQQVWDEKEAGVDNPDATLMIIENADRFGLSQLHQLRGRVGRGSKASRCLLVSHLAENSERLKILCATNDGFELSLEDLKIRGPGDLVGTRQSGLSHPCFSHRIPPKMVENARNRAFEILTKEKTVVKDWFMKQMITSFGDTYKTFMEGG
jgi:ATP-dependent DNA helicase RecG